MDPRIEQDVSVEGRIVEMFFAIRPSAAGLLVCFSKYPEILVPRSHSDQG